jgi:preprotein translocase subunit YajC
MELMADFAFIGLLAQATGNGSPGPTGLEGLLKGPLPMMLFLFVIMYVVMIRPQQKKAREHAALLKTLKAGDKVVTSGGVLGIVIAVKDKTVSLRSSDSKLEVLKSSVAEITERSDANSDS